MLAEPTRTAVYGPVRTVVWQGSAGDCVPYVDQIEVTFIEPLQPVMQKNTKDWLPRDQNSGIPISLPPSSADT